MNRGRTMMSNKVSHAADLLGLSRLTVSAVTGVADLAEEVQLKLIGQAPDVVARPLARATSLIYSGVRGVTRLVGGGVDGVLSRLEPLLGEGSSWAGREPLLAAVNGVLGDYLAETANPLQIPMQFRRDGAPFVPQAGAVTGRVLVLVHGLCMNDLQWRRAGYDHGDALQRERGYTPVYLRYNSGRHISENGHEFAARLEALLAQWPVPVKELVIVGHSMGGLVARSAYYYGSADGQKWVKRLSKLVCLGSPHHGAPLERGGNWFHVITGLSSYTAPFSRLGKIRSAGITDLRHGSLLDEDWNGKDRFEHGSALPQTVALPAKVACYAVAATISKASAEEGGRLAGDGLVPVASALGQHSHKKRQLDFAPERQAKVYRTNHMDLLNSPEVAQLLLDWL
jgi:pimeloyl-ACP methyl ester carboxylesterase